MRMWNVKPRLLCNQHLLGEHVELHMFAGSIRKGIGMKGYIEGGLVEIHNIKKRHKQLVIEMERRGYNHKSPLPKFEVYEAGKVSAKTNVKELKRRCERCRKKMSMSMSKS